MLRHDVVVSHLRFYNEESTDPYPPYDAICTIVWESKDTIWVKGLHGKLNLSLYKELANWIIQCGIKLVKLERAGNHTMPFASYNSDNYYEVEINDKLKKWANRA